MRHFDAYDPSIETDAAVLSQVLAMLALLDELLTRHSIPYWITHGTLLGSIRHGDIIPWDDDADLMIWQSDLSKVRALRREVGKAGYSLGRFYGGIKLFPKNGKPMRNPNYLYPFVDVFSAERTSERVQFARKGPRQTFPNGYYLPHEVEPLRRYRLADLSLSGPYDAEPYLNRLYGSDWRTVGRSATSHDSEEGRELVFSIPPHTVRPPSARGPSDEPTWVDPRIRRGFER